MGDSEGREWARYTNHLFLYKNKMVKRIFYAIWFDFIWKKVADEYRLYFCFSVFWTQKTLQNRKQTFFYRSDKKNTILKKFSFFIAYYNKIIMSKRFDFTRRVVVSIKSWSYFFFFSFFLIFRIFRLLGKNTKTLGSFAYFKIYILFKFAFITFIIKINDI